MKMKVLATDPKERFSNRVDDYVRYRPGYPRAIPDVLRDECGLVQESIVADIGSGTGILTQLFLENGNLVYGVEPNSAVKCTQSTSMGGLLSLTLAVRIRALATSTQTLPSNE